MPLPFRLIMPAFLLARRRHRVLPFFLRPPHKILKLRPESLDRAELIPNLRALAILSSIHLYMKLHYIARPYRDNTFQITIQSIDILQNLLHALLE